MKVPGYDKWKTTPPDDDDEVTYIFTSCDNSVEIEDTDFDKIIRDIKKTLSIDTVHGDRGIVDEDGCNIYDGDGNLIGQMCTISGCRQ